MSLNHYLIPIVLPLRQQTLLREAAASNRTGGFSNSQKPHFLTGNWSGAEDIGSQSVLTNLGINSQRLIIFGGNTYTGGGTDAITFSLAAGGDTFDDDASMIIISGAGNDIYSSYIKGGTNDNSVDLTLTPARSFYNNKSRFIPLL